MKHVIVLTVICCLTVIVGCSTSQSVSLLTPSARETVLATSNTVIKGTLTDVLTKADLTLAENLDIGGAPSKPKNGWKHDYTINVESVVKGTFPDPILRLQGLKDPAHNDFAYTASNIRPGQKVYVGWRSRQGDTYVDLMIVNAGEKPITTAP